jgi:L-aminopeptidase/D-esterase-like protein
MTITTGAPRAVMRRKPRARDLGIPFEGATGPRNAITDVAGVEVGYSTIVKGNGALERGKGPVRTGVTAILPRGKTSKDPAFAAWYSLNGNGEMTGTAWIDVSGFLEGPVMITNTHSVGVVRDAVIDWQVRKGALYQPFSLPVVAETYDGWLNDIDGFHVTSEHALEALDTAAQGPIAEGNVGGGTGMATFEFKGGTGTASRQIFPKVQGGYTVGVLVQSNFGRRFQLQIAGVPVGRELRDDAPWTQGRDEYNDIGSIIVVVATDAPLLPHQLKRLLKRVSLGIGRTGGLAMNGSGDIFIAFSTANAGVAQREQPVSKLSMVSNEWIDPLLASTMLATEEAIINAMVAAETMSGVDGHTLVALPHDRLQDVLRKYNRLAPPVR